MDLDTEKIKPFGTEKKISIRDEVIKLLSRMVCCGFGKKPPIFGNQVDPVEQTVTNKLPDAIVTSRSSNLAVRHLTEREIYNFEKIWKHVQKNLPEIGKNAFTELFQKNPGLSESFDKFRGLTGESLLNSVVLEVHGMVVMNTMDEIVSHMDEGSDFIEEILEEIGVSHARFGSQIKIDDFWELLDPFVNSIQNNLTGLNTNTMKLIRKVVRFIITGITNGFKKEWEKNGALLEKIDANDPSSISASFYSGSHKKPDLSEIIEKDMEEKIHTNELLHQHHHHHHKHHHRKHHHNHHHDNPNHNRERGSVFEIGSSIASGDWAIDSHSSIKVDSRSSSYSSASKSKRLPLKGANENQSASGNSLQVVVSNHDE